MATGKPPWSQQFQEVAALFHIGTTKSHPPIPEHLSCEAKDFLLKCLRKEPNLRPTATELLQHPFVKQGYSECGIASKHPATVSASIQGQVFGGTKTYEVMESSKRRQTSHDALEESNVRRSLAFCHKPGNSQSDAENHSTECFTSDLDCSVRMDSVQFGDFMMKSFKSTSNFDHPLWEQSSFSPMNEPQSFNSIRESSYLKDGWSNGTEDGFVINKDAEIMPATGTEQHSAKDDLDFSFQCVPVDDDEEVTESKIKAFLDEKALELKRLQTPLYMEFESIWKITQQNGGTNSPKNTGHHKGGAENLVFPSSPAAGRHLTTGNSRSPSKGSSLSGPSMAFNSHDSEASVSSGSPGGGNPSINFSPRVELPSPRLHEWKGLLQETQQGSPSPSTFYVTEQQRQWKEELQKELESKREEKRMLSRLTGNSKSSSPKDKAHQRHAVSRLSCASPISRSPVH